MIDLHMHSYYSDDGEFQPEELVQKCKEEGIRYMAIADHNCVRAVEKGRKAAQKEGIHFISGVEIDCTWVMESMKGTRLFKRSRTIYQSRAVKHRLRCLRRREN